MTERQRLQAVLSGRIPDCTPWYGDLSWWYAAHSARGTLPEAYSGDEGYLRMHRDAGVGIYLFAPMLWTETYDDTVEMVVSREGTQTVTVLRTPVGQVRSVLEDLPESGTSAYVEHFVKCPQDLRVMEYAFTHRRMEPAYAAFQDCDCRWGDAGMAAVLTPVCTSALQTLMTRWAGVETTIALWADARPDLERTIGVLQESDDPIFDLICHGPGRLVVFPENLSGEITSRWMLRTYALPYWRRRLGQLHDAGKLAGIHNDGTLRGSLPILMEAGFDFIESVTPAPVGDMTLEEIRDATAGCVLIWGGLPGALFSPITSHTMFDEFVRHVLSTFPLDSRFVLRVADQVPPDAHFERVCRVREILDGLR